MKVAFKFIFIAAVAFAAALSLNKPLYAGAPEPSDQTIAKEMKMGEKTVKSIEDGMTRVLDPETEEQLDRITARLIPFTQRNLHYEVRIVEADVPNAFSLPGGYTYITTEMLKILESDDEIAAVLAHEFVHADRAHVLVQTARSSKLDIISLIGLIAAAQGGGAGAAVVAGAVQTAYMNSYAIDLEKEADARGIEMLHKAGYNPTAMLVLMEKLNVEDLKRRSYESAGIYQNHPEDSERIEAAVQYMKDNKIEIQRKLIKNNLKAHVTRIYGDRSLMIDKNRIIALPAADENEEFLQGIADKLNELIELELAPYDIYVVTRPYGKEIMIRGKKIVSEPELTQQSASINEIRNRINAAIIDARLENTVSNYFR